MTPFIQFDNACSGLVQQPVRADTVDAINTLQLPVDNFRIRTFMADCLPPRDRHFAPWVTDMTGFD